MNLEFLLCYIDAGSGSLLIQALAAGFFAFVIFFRRIMTWVRSLLK